MPIRAGRPRRVRPAPWIGALLIAVSLAPSLGDAARAATQPTLSDCRRPDAPASFHRELRVAIRLSGNLPGDWAASPYIAKIVSYGGAAVGKSPAMPPNPDLAGKPEVAAALREKVRGLGGK